MLRPGKNQFAPPRGSLLANAWQTPPLSGYDSDVGGVVQGVRGAERGGKGRESSLPPGSGLAKAQRAPPLSGSDASLGGASQEECGAERGGVAQASSRPPGSGLAEALQAPPPSVCGSGLGWGAPGGACSGLRRLGLWQGSGMPPLDAPTLGLWPRDGECEGGGAGPASQQEVSLGWRGRLWRQVSREEHEIFSFPASREILAWRKLRHKVTLGSGAEPVKPGGTRPGMELSRGVRENSGSSVASGKGCLGRHGPGVLPAEFPGTMAQGLWPWIESFPLGVT